METIKEANYSIFMTRLAGAAMLEKTNKRQLTAGSAVNVGCSSETVKQK